MSEVNRYVTLGNPEVLENLDERNGHLTYKGVEIKSGENGLNGRDGHDGVNGVSPVVTVEEIEGGRRITITDADHPEGQSYDVLDAPEGSNHTHRNKLSLDKLIVTPSLIQTLTDESIELNEGTVIVVTDVDMRKPKLSRIDSNEDSVNGYVCFDHPLEYNEHLTVENYPYSVLLRSYRQVGVNHEYYNLQVGLVSVISSNEEQSAGSFGMSFVADEPGNNYLHYVMCVDRGTVSKKFTTDAVIADFGNGRQVDEAILLYSFSNMTGHWKKNDGTVLSDTFELAQGWNILVAAKDGNGDLADMRIAPIDPNQYIKVGFYSSRVWTVSGVSENTLLDTFYYEKYEDNRGIWSVDSYGIIDFIGGNYYPAVSSLESKIRQIHTHDNQLTLDKFSEQDGNPLFNGHPLSDFVESFVKDYTHKLHNTFRIRDGRLQVDTSTGLAHIGEDGHLYVDTDAAGNITENNRLEVMV